MSSRRRGTLQVDSLKRLLPLFLCLRLLLVQVHGVMPARADNLVLCPLVKGFRREQSKQPLEKQQGRQNFASKASGVTVGESCLFLLCETGSHFAAQAGLELGMLSPQHPACWESAPVPPGLASYRAFPFYEQQLLKHLVGIQRGSVGPSSCGLETSVSLSLHPLH